MKKYYMIVYSILAFACFCVGAWLYSTDAIPKAGFYGYAIAFFFILEYGIAKGRLEDYDN